MLYLLQIVLQQIIGYMYLFQFWFLQGIFLGVGLLGHKNAEHQRIDAFELRYWRRLLRVPWTARRSNQSVSKEVKPEYLLEGLMLKLKFQYFVHMTSVHGVAKSRK